jgi:hypothetical protein
VVFDPPAFDPDQTLELIGRLGVRTFCAPPTVSRTGLARPRGGPSTGV